MSGLQLSTHFAVGISGGMDIDVQIPRLEVGHLRISQFCARWDALFIAALGQRDDDRAILSRGRVMDMSGGP